MHLRFDLTSRSTSISAVCLLLAQLSAGTSLGADPRAVITDPPEENSLPIGMTQEELSRQHEIGANVLVTQPPTGPIRQCAEWEPVTGVLVRYPFGHPYPVLKEMAEDIELWVLVASTSQQNTCSSSLQANGVNMANVHFVIVQTNSIWTRDYGPQFVFDGNGDAGIVDHVYNRPRPLDDQVNYAIGTAWTTPVYGTSLIHTGGNYLCDGHGNGFSTDLVWDENPGLTHAQIDQSMHDYLGINAYHVVDDVSIGGIHHLDVWGKMLDERTFLVKQVPTNNPDYARCEARAAELASLTNCYGQPLKVARVYCDWINGSEVAGYTNSVILNNKVLVPTFGIAADAQAIATYQQLMPGYEILGFNGSWLSDDAIHCRAMGIHDKGMLYVDTAPLPDTLGAGVTIHVEAKIDDRSEAGLIPSQCRLYWKLTTDLTYQSAQLDPVGPADIYAADLPPQAPGNTVQYYIAASDLSGRHWQRPPAAPAGAYRFYVAGSPTGVADTFLPRLVLEPASPNPFRESMTVRFSAPRGTLARAAVIDAQGRAVRSFLLPDLSTGQAAFDWDGRDAGGAPAPAGVYLIRIEAGEEVHTTRAVRIR